MHFEPNQLTSRNKSEQATIRKLTADSQTRTMKRPKLQLENSAKTLNQRKSVGRPPDASRAESSSAHSFDPPFFASLEKIHSIGMEQYIDEEDASTIPFKDLIKKIEHLNFTPGVLKDNIYIIKQVSQISQMCTMSVDVHPVETLIQFDNISEVFTGFVAPLCSEMKLASEVVTFMLQGFTVEWKCLAGFMFVNFEEDGWAVWHVLNQIMLLLAQYEFTVVNVVLGEGCGFDILDNHADENMLKADSIVRHPHFPNVSVSFAKGVDELVQNISESLLQENFILPDEIVEKFELVQNSLKPEHLMVLIGSETLSANLIATYLFQWKREFPEDEKMPALKTEIFILRMLWMWVNAMTFIIDDDASGFYSKETHIQTLRDTACIFEVLEKSPDLKSDESLWSSVRRTTSSAFSLYDHYVGKGLVSSIGSSTFRCMSLHHLKGLVDCDNLSSEIPKPSSVLQFLRMVNTALLLHPNFAAKDFENGMFFSEYLKHRGTFFPVHIEKSEDISDINGLGLYYLSSRVVTKLVNDNNCDKCKAALVADDISPNIPTVWLKAVRKKNFFHPTMSVYDTLQWAESHFVNFDDDKMKLNKPCTQFAYRIYGEMAFSIRSTFPSCHDCLRTLLSVFISTRLKMVAEDLTNRLK